MSASEVQNISRMWIEEKTILQIKVSQIIVITAYDQYYTEIWINT